MVTDDRLEALVWGWGPGEEGMVVDRWTITGDTSRPEIFDSAREPTGWPSAI